MATSRFNEVGGRPAVESLIEPELLEQLTSAGGNLGHVYHGVVPSLTPNRFDLGFKLNFLEGRLSDAASGPYLEHIRAFSLGSFREPGKAEKNSFAKYVEEFRKLFRAIRDGGFRPEISLVPSAADGSILNGAHRTAAAIFLSKEVSILRTELPPVVYDFRFFERRGAPRWAIDAAAISYAEFAEDCKVALIWPVASGQDEKIERILGRIVCRKDVLLNSRGAKNLIANIYKEEPWLGTREDDFPGAMGKVGPCFCRDAPLRVILFQDGDLHSVRDKKGEIRRLFALGKHSIHVTDSHKETISVLRLLYNDNAIHYLNYARVNKFADTMQKLERFREYVTANGLSLDDVAIDGGMVLEVYGLREASDIDVLSEFPLSAVGDHLIHDHSQLLPFHGVDVGTLVRDPRYHFQIDGVKFISFRQLFRMYRNRNATKDVRLMMPLVEAAPIRGRVEVVECWVRSRLQWIKSVVARAIAWPLRRMGIYYQVRSVYRTVVLPRTKKLLRHVSNECWRSR